MKGVLGIIGAGTLGQHVAHYVKDSGLFDSIVFFDDTMPSGTKNIYGTVLGGIEEVENRIAQKKVHFLLIGIGYNHMNTREKLYERFSPLIPFPNIIHQSAYIDNSCSLGFGNIILPGCIIDKDCTLGNNNFFNPGCIVAHDNKIGNHNFFGPGVRFSGFIKTQNKSFFGTATCVVDNIEICSEVKTGAGSVIVHSIDNPGIYIGVPAKIMK